MIKICTRCKKRKSISLFYHDARNVKGLTARCKDCIRISAAKTYKKYKEKRKSYGKKYYLENHDIKNKRAKEKYKKIICELFNLLGNTCKKCGFEDRRALQLDHINGGGSKERKIRGSDYRQYQRAIKKIIKGDKSFQITLTEGKKHQIRRMAMALGYTVIDLQRTRVMNIRLRKLPLGNSRQIKGEELKNLLEKIGLA